jgi:surface carbohydrate biosynthesis protein
MNASRHKVNVLFPLEVLNRELDSKLILACISATAANRIFIGQHDVLFDVVTKTGMTGGVYVGKNIFRDLFPIETGARYRELKQQGFALVHLHEEGAVFEGDEERWRKTLLDCLNPAILDKDDYLCTWGDFQRDYYQSLNPPCVGNIVTTGHPRFDYLKPSYRSYFEPDVQRIKARLGQFILINSAFGQVNNCLGLADTFSPRLNYDPADAGRRVATFSTFAHEALFIGAFIKLANNISLRWPDINIVWRPHPSENWDYYRTVFANIPNVHVLHEGPVTPWLMACSMLIHNGCTTGIEAYFAGTNVINYKPSFDPFCDLYLPNLFGVECPTEDAVMCHVDAMLGTVKPAGPSARLDEYAHALMRNFREDATSHFLKVLEATEQRQARVLQTWNPGAIRRGERVRSAVEALKNIVRPALPEKQRTYKALKSHFVGLDTSLVETKVRALEAMLGKCFAVTFYSSDLFSIELDG